MKDTFNLHQWFFDKYSLYENDDPKIGAEEEGDPNEYVVGENDSLKYSIAEYIADNKNININDIKNYLNELKSLAEAKSTLCKRGQDYIKFFFYFLALLNQRCIRICIGCHVCNF